MVCAEVTISTCVNSWWVIIELDSSSLSSYCMISSMKYNRSEVVMGKKNKQTPFLPIVSHEKAAGVITATY